MMCCNKFHVLGFVGFTFIFYADIPVMVRVTASVTDLNILALDPRVWHSLVIGPVVTGYKYNTDITHCVLN